MCLPNFLEKRGASVESSLEAKVVEEADFVNRVVMGRERGRGSIGLVHTWRWQREEKEHSSSGRVGAVDGMTGIKREMCGQDWGGSKHTRVGARGVVVSRAL